MTNLREAYGVAIAAAVLLAGCAAGAAPAAAPQPPAASPASAATPAGGTRSVLAGVYTGTQAARGQQGFQRSCASCHSAAEFSGPIFQTVWSGRPVGELYEVISTLMPQNNPGGLTPQQYTDIITFFLRQNGYPEGGQELPPDPAALRRITFEPAR